MADDSFPITCSISWAASKKTVRQTHVSHLLAHPTRAGTGAVYSFDPVGSYEREGFRAAGAAQELVQPFLDSQACPPLLVFISDTLPMPDFDT